MDLTKITDAKELKALAYDELVKKNIAEQNLAAINTRLQQLESEPKVEEEPKDNITK